MIMADSDGPSGSDSLEGIFPATKVEPGDRKVQLMAWVAELGAQLESLGKQLSLAEAMIADEAGAKIKSRRQRRKEQQRQKKRAALEREAKEAVNARLCGGMFGVAFGKDGDEDARIEAYYVARLPIGRFPG